jgi:hypothetical protein
MGQEEAILEAASAIRPHLQKLLGDEADAVDSKLDELVQQAQDGKQVDMQILTLLLQHASTQEWLAEYLKGRQPSESETKYFPPPVGYPTSLQLYGEPKQSLKYHCPLPGHRNFIVYLYFVGEDKPQCPEHHVPLVPVVNNRGGEHADEIDGGIGR